MQEILKFILNEYLPAEMVANEFIYYLLEHINTQDLEMVLINLLGQLGLMDKFIKRNPEREKHILKIIKEY